MIWRDVVGFEGRYEVSDEGSVRNAQTGRMLKPQRCTNRYLALCLGRKNRRLVHRLVAEVTLGVADGSVSSAVRLGHRCKGYTVQYV